MAAYIELGCGPYTNTRLVLQNRSAARVVCSDPLIHSYVTFPDRWLAEAYRAGNIEIDDHPIEECPFPPGTFDVVVMINVLDHVRDAELCLRTAGDLVKPNGYLVLGQDLSNDEDVARMPVDVGHPIRLHQRDVEPYLRDFSPVFRKDLNRAQGRNPAAHYSTLIFAGQKVST